MEFFDETDSMAGPNFRNGPAKDKNGLVIQFYHVPTIHKSLQSSNFLSHATFKAFLTDFSDNFKVNWNQKETLGRMDSIQTFKNTQRTIGISFDVPANSEIEAIQNFFELQKLIMMQYPVYETIDVNLISKNVATANTQVATNPDGTFSVERDVAANIAATQENWVLTSKKTTGRFMSSPPLIYVKFKNWIGNADNYSAQEDVSDSLVVVLSDVKFKPDLESGTFINEDKLIPMLFSIDLNMAVIHTSEVGWTKDKTDQYLFGEPKDSEVDPQVNVYKSFPYGTSLTPVDK